ncbi:MAG: Na/Pi cotransporter family protein [Planctomycetaceae bacterium]|nr:Na/Pi cotransporter family protein [Planctomycetaceae bacterium]
MTQAVVIEEVVPEKENDETEVSTPNILPSETSTHEYIRTLKRVSAHLGTKRIELDLKDTFGEVKQFQNGPVELKVMYNSSPKVVQITPDHFNLTLEFLGVGTSDVTIRATDFDSGFYVDTKINIEVWTPNYWKMILSVIGGLGVFLLGMKYMSEGFQAVAGDRLRRMISTFTDNRFFAVLAGLVTTSIIQSSSVTTVMVVGFINSQIMTLSQGIGVIMGANIGTTVTGWILTIKIGDYGLPLLGICAFVYMFSKRDKIKFLFMALMGLGAVFFGLEIMSNGFSVLKDVPEFSRWMEAFSATSTFGVLKCALVGCLLTLIVQSSSATIGITISLAAIGVIDFPTAGALVLGENIGTTITALLASIGTSVNAKRAAVFHTLFNLFGVCWVTIIFLRFYLPFITSIVGINPETGQIANIKTGIALTHTVFNVTNTLVFLPFSGYFAGFLARIIPDRGGAVKKLNLTSLHPRLLETSSIAIERSRIEVLRMANGCVELTEWVKKISFSDTAEEELVNQAFRQEQVLDGLQDEIIEFMAELLSGNVSHDIAETARGQLRMADELESISDYLVTIMKSNLKLRQDNLAFPEAEKQAFLELHDMSASYLSMIRRCYSERKNGIELLTEVYSQGQNITHRVKTMRDKFLKYMSRERLDPLVIMAFNAQLNAYRRVREHAQNVAEAIVGIK